MLTCNWLDLTDLYPKISPRHCIPYKPGKASSMCFVQRKQGRKCILIFFACVPSATRLLSLLYNECRAWLIVEWHVSVEQATRGNLEATCWRTTHTSYLHWYCAIRLCHTNLGAFHTTLNIHYYDNKIHYYNISLHHNISGKSKESAINLMNGFLYLKTQQS